MEETFGSTCHGAGRARSRNSSRNKLDYQQVLDALKAKGIAIRCAAAPLLRCHCRTAAWLLHGCAMVAAEQGRMRGFRHSSACRHPSRMSTTPCPLHPPAPLSAPLHRSVASPKLVMEEAPESYKDVSQVVDTCHEAGISRKAVKLRPIGVVKG